MNAYFLRCSTMDRSSKSLSIARLPVFSVLADFVASSDNQAYRQAFLAHLDQDIPNLKSLIETELKRSTLAAGVQEWFSKHYTTNSAKTSLNLASLRSETLQQAFPANLGYLAKHPVLRKRSSNAPWMLTLSDSVFSKEAANPASAGAMLSEMLEASMEKSPQCYWPKDVLNQRTEALLEVVTPEILALYVQAVPNNLRTSTLLSPTTQQALAQLLESTKTATATSSDLLVPSNDEDEATTVAFPEESATLTFLSARRELLERLGQLKGKPNGEWLNREIVWKTVRDLAAQAPFAARVSSLLSNLESNETPDETEEATTGLLASLELPGKKDHSKQAHLALKGYLDSIRDPADLAAMIPGLLKGQDQKRTDYLLEQIQEVSSRIRFSLKDAAAFLEDHLVDERNPNPGRILEALYNSSWSPQALDSILKHKPLPLQPRCVIPLVVVLWEKQPDVLNGLTDDGVVRLVHLWPADAGYVFERTNDKFVQALVKRVEKLSTDAKTEILKNNTQHRWKKRETLEANLRISASALKGMTGSELEQAFSAASEVLWDTNACSELVSLFPAEHRSQDGAARLLKLFHTKRGLRGEHLETVAALVGYEKGKEPHVASRAAWDFFSDSEKRRLIGSLSAAAIQQEFLAEQGLGRHERQRGQGKPVPPSVLQNMVFDLTERLAPQPNVVLKRGDGLVTLRLASAGETVEWAAIMDLVAPFLKATRPQISWDKAPAKASLDNPPSANGGVITAEILEGRLNSRQASANRHRDRRDRRDEVFMMGGFPPHPMFHPMMERDFMEQAMFMEPEMLLRSPFASFLPKHHQRDLMAVVVAMDLASGGLSSFVEPSHQPGPER